MKKILLSVLLCFIYPLMVLADDLSTEERILRQKILYGSGSNYLKNAYYAGSQVLRWNKSEFPIKVFIENNPNVPKYYAYGFIKAVAIWQKEMDGVLNFTFVGNEKAANVVFKIVPKKELIRKVSGTETNILAYTLPVTDGNKLQKMYIYFFERKMNNKLFEQDEIINLAVHEFGHALGVAGHSNDKTSIMYALYNPGNQKISYFLNEQDKNTFKLLYMVEPNITNGDKTKETGNIRTEVLVGSENERVTASILNEEKELKIKPGDSMSRLKLAILYMQKNDYQTMSKYIKEAESYAKTNDELHSVHVAYAYYFYSFKDKKNALLHVDKALQLKDVPTVRDFKTQIEKLR